MAFRHVKKISRYALHEALSEEVRENRHKEYWRSKIRTLWLSGDYLAARVAEEGAAHSSMGLRPVLRTGCGDGRFSTGVTVKHRRGAGAQIGKQLQAPPRYMECVGPGNATSNPGVGSSASTALVVHVEDAVNAENYRASAVNFARQAAARARAPSDLLPVKLVIAVSSYLTLAEWSSSGRDAVGRCDGFGRSCAGSAARSS